MHIVFDLDGTLVDSHAQVIATTRAVVAELTGAELSLEEVARREAGTFEATFASYGIAGERLVREAIPRWGAHALTHTYRAFAGIAGLLAELAATHRLSVWTARDAASAQGILASTDLERYFGGRLAAWQPRTPKPDPRGLGELVGGADPADVVVVGDGATDLRGALGYGATAISALWGGHADARALAAAGGTRFAFEPRACLTLLPR